MNKIIAAFFCIAIATVSSSVFGYAGPFDAFDGGVALRGPSSGATVSGPSGTITATADAGAVGAAPSAAGVVASPPVNAPAPAVVPAAAPVVVEARSAPWAAVPGAWALAPWAPAAVRTFW